MIPRADWDHTVQDYIPGQPIPTLIRDPKTGKVYVNELKRYVKPYTLVTEPASIVLEAAKASTVLSPTEGLGPPSDPIPMVIDSKGHFEIMQSFFTSQRAEGFTVQLFDPDMRPILMNRAVHVSTIASGGGVTGVIPFDTGGSAGRPFIWPETFFMDVDKGGRAIFAVFRNCSNQSNTIRFGFHGQRWYHTQAPYKIANRMQQIYRTRFRTFPFFYTTDQDIVILPGQATSFDMRFTDEAWTEWYKGMSFAPIQDDEAPNDPFLVRIRETATGKLFMDQFVQSQLVFGNGEWPFLCWEPMLFEPNYKLTFEISADSDMVTVKRIFITLACRKILWDPHEEKLLRPGVAAGAPL